MVPGDVGVGVGDSPQRRLHQRVVVVAELGVDLGLVGVGGGGGVGVGVGGGPARRQRRQGGVEQRRPVRFHRHRRREGLVAPLRHLFEVRTIR